MKTKKEILKQFAEFGHCNGIKCQTECPYYMSKHCPNVDLNRIGAKAILRQNRKKRGFDINKILTCVTADQAKVGMRGYFADNLTELKIQFKCGTLSPCIEIQNEDFINRFVADDGLGYALFYPIDEVEDDRC